MRSLMFIALLYGLGDLRYQELGRFTRTSEYFLLYSSEALVDMCTSLVTPKNKALFAERRMDGYRFLSPRRKDTLNSYYAVIQCFI